MLRTIAGLTIVLLVIITAKTTNAVEFGTREEAVAMVKRVQDRF